MTYIHFCLLLLCWETSSPHSQVKKSPKTTLIRPNAFHQSNAKTRNLKINLKLNRMLENEMWWSSSVWMMVPIGHTRLMLGRRVVEPLLWPLD